MTKETLIVRLDKDLKSKVCKLARNEGKSASQVVREVLEEYVKNRDVGVYIDDLWERIGGKLKSRGFEERDLPRVIREARKNKK